MKKFLSLLLALVCVFSAGFSAAAVGYDEGLEALQAQFQKGNGPEVNGYSLDYRWFSPAKENDSTKYPLVIWLHGMMEGSHEGKQVTENNIAYWTSEEFQSRFQPAGGAYILAPRSPEEDSIYWNEDMIEPVRAIIDEFIKSHNVDTTRIYIGGFSMGGKMTLNMAVAYPEMFAAAFPICPAWSPTAEQLEYVADLPIWITSSKKDPIVNYNTCVTPLWNKLTKVTNLPEACRFSSLTTSRFEDGKKCVSNHHAWFSVNHDMFTVDGGKYPEMSTVNAKGEAVELTYPDGMISWLSGFSSDYDGTPAEGKGNLEGMKNIGNIVAADLSIWQILKGAFTTLFTLLFVHPSV